MTNKKLENLEDKISVWTLVRRTFTNPLTYRLAGRFVIVFSFHKPENNICDLMKGEKC